MPYLSLQNSAGD